MQIRSFSVVALLFHALTASSLAAEGVKYTPGGKEWAKVWTAFYNNTGGEEELMTPLVKAGPKMTPAILEAISHKDMKQRRYAIGALGHLKDRRAVEPLTAVLKDKREEDYFRGDALHAIYQIDQKLGSELAKQFSGQGDNLKMIAGAIIKKEPWLLDSGN